MQLNRPLKGQKVKTSPRSSLYIGSASLPIKPVNLPISGPNLPIKPINLPISGPNYPIGSAVPKQSTPTKTSAAPMPTTVKKKRI